MASLLHDDDNYNNGEMEDEEQQCQRPQLHLPHYITNVTIGKSVRCVKKNREQNRLFRIKSIKYDFFFIQRVLLHLKIISSTDSYDIKIKQHDKNCKSISNGTTDSKAHTNCNIKIYANLRNGLWYYPKFHGTAYFKSTDGHSHKWNFSFKKNIKSNIYSHLLFIISNA